MAVSPKMSNPRVHRLVLLMVAVVAISYVRVQHYAVNSHLDDKQNTPLASRRLAQRIEKDPVQALMGVEAPVHGFVKKAGTTALANWHPAYVPLRTKQFKVWMEQKGSVLDGASPAGLNLLGVKPPYILPFHDGRGCNIYYNERYKVIFLRTQKVASTTTMTFFGECANEPERPTCLKPLDLEDALQLQLMWRNYFVFGWSRNPWARAVSSYQYLLHAVKDLPQCDRVDWDTFCQDPLVFGELCRAHPECCPVFNHNFMWFHVNDQTTCLTTDSGEWAADFIGRSEHFDEDFVFIVDAINQRLPSGVEPLSIKARPESQNTNEVGCSDKLQRRPKRAKQPSQDAGGSSSGEQAAAAAAAAEGAATAAGAAESGAAAAAVDTAATKAAAEQAGAADPAAGAEQGAIAKQETLPRDAGGAAAEQHSEAGSATTDQGQIPEAAEATAVADIAVDEPRAAAQGAQEEQQQPGPQGQQEQGQGQQQEQSQSQQQPQQEGARRRLLYGKLPGFLFAEENYCDKRKFYTGRHEACFQQVARFYGNDIQRLGFNKLLRAAGGRQEEAPILAHD